MKSSVISLVRLYLQRKSAYFREKKSAITADNVQVMPVIAGLITLLVVVQTIGNCLVNNGNLCSINGLPMVFALVACLLSWLATSRYAKTGEVPDSQVIGFCTLLDFTTILSETVGRSYISSAAAQLQFLVVHTLLIIPLRFSISLLMTSELAYCGLSVALKSRPAAHMDVIGAAMGFFLTIYLSYMTTKFRLRDFDNLKTLERLSTRDALSNLLNRRAFLDEAQMLLNVRNPFTSCSLAFIDIDDFKSVNDTYGHEAGDVALRELSTLLREQFRPNDIVARYGGDEFLVLIDELNDQAIIEKRVTELRHRYHIATSQSIGCAVNLSAGVITVAMQYAKLDDLIAQADASLYKAKKAGGNRCVITPYKICTDTHQHPVDSIETQDN